MTSGNSTRAAQALALGIFAIAAALILGAALLSFRYFSEQFIHDAQMELEAINALKSAKIELLMQERMRDTQVFAERRALQFVLDRMPRRHDYAAEFQRVIKAIDDTTRAYGYQEIFVLNNALEVLAPREKITLQPSERAALETAIRDRQPALADVHIGADGTPEYGIAQPIFRGGDRGAAVIGAVFFERDGKRHLFPTLRGWPTPSPSGESMLLRREGEQAVVISTLRQMPFAPPLSLRHSLAEKQNLLAKAVATGDGLIEGFDYRGVASVGAVQRVVGTPWFIASTMDRDEIERPVHTLAIVIASLVALLLATAAAVAWLLWQWRERSLAADRFALAERYATAIRTSIDGYLVAGAGNSILEVNPAVSFISGYTEAELLQMSVKDLEAVASPEQISARTERMAGAGGGHFQGRWRRKDGKFVDVEVSASRLHDPKGNELHVFIRDVTGRKRVEAALRESEERWKLALEGAGDGVWDKNLQTGETVYSKGYCEMFGFAPGDHKTLSDTWGSRVHPEDLPRVLADRQAHFDGKTPIYSKEQRLRCKDGSWKWVLARGVVIKHGEDGTPLRFIGTVVDISERKRLDEVRLRSQKLESLGTLAGGVAHDFNNILLAINGNARLALEDAGPGHPLHESLAEIAKAGRRATDLVRRILAFGRPQSEGRETVELQPVIEEAVKLLRSTLPTMIEFRTGYAQDVPVVEADTTQVHEAVVNLATNAAYALEGRSGWIEFRLEGCELSAELAARLPGLCPGRYARLSVADNGCGMDTATLGRIFDAFFTTKPPGTGTGLGLSLVHGIMKAHEGAVAVESRPGQGSVFDLYFPAARNRLQPRPQPPQSRAQSTRRHVLYLDDEEALVLLMSRLLTRLGHKVSGFTAVDAALAAYRREPQDFDVVVTDLSMPHASGFDVAREVLALRPDLPVVMTTGYIRPEDEARARAAGICALILKPNTVDELSVALDRLVQRAEPCDSAANSR